MKKNEVKLECSDSIIRLLVVALICFTILEWRPITLDSAKLRLEWARQNRVGIFDDESDESPIGDSTPGDKGGPMENSVEQAKLLKKPVVARGPANRRTQTPTGASDPKPTVSRKSGNVKRLAPTVKDEKAAPIPRILGTDCAKTAD